MDNGVNIEKDSGCKCKWYNGLNAYTKQLHTSLSFLFSLKPVDLSTPLYNQGAHKPSIGFGPASQLASLKLSSQFLYMYALTLLYSSSFDIN